MNLALWIVAGLLAVAYLVSGGGKLIMPKEKIAAVGRGVRWVEDFSAGSVKAIGALEVLAAVGLILPAVLDIAPVLVPLAALGLAMLMVGAAITRFRRREFTFMVGGPGLCRPGRLRGVGPLRPRVLHRLTGRDGCRRLTWRAGVPAVGTRERPQGPADEDQQHPDPGRHGGDAEGDDRGEQRRPQERRGHGRLPRRVLPVELGVGLAAGRLEGVLLDRVRL